MESPEPPLVSVLLAVHNGVPYVETAVASVLRQTLPDLELVVVDDASGDDTPKLLARVEDRRVRVMRNDRQVGLAASLNRALRHARGRYVARLDADDVAFPDWLERLSSRLGSERRLSVAGSAMLDIDRHGRPAQLHVMPATPIAVRWHALFSAPFFHSTVVVERDVLERNDLAYDTRYPESEDYDLWTRLLEVAEGANVDEALVLHRRHSSQASVRRRGLQRSHQREIALRQIRALAPNVDAELAWSLAMHEDASKGARAAYRQVLEAFERRYGSDRAVRSAAARTLARAGSVRDRTASAHLAGRKMRRALHARSARRHARAWLAALHGDRVRVTVVSPEPTPYRAPLFDRVASRPEIELTVVYAARTVAGRTWTVEPRHRHVFLRGLGLPARRLLRHDYPVTPGILRVLRESRPDVVAVTGWSTFPSQAAIAWCRARQIPYVLLVESHDVGPRSGWRRALKDAVVPPIVRSAAGVLAVGTLARESMIARGAAPGRVRVFANTIDVERWIARADTTRRAPRTGVFVLSVGRAVPEKGFDVLEQACEQAGVALEIVSGGLTEDELAPRYVNADVFALLSRYEPWGVVVNEAAATGLPLVLSDRVGAARDLLRDGENGFLVPAEDVDAAAKALRELAADPEKRRRFGERSRELARAWGYEPSVENFVAAVLEARGT
jgi:glycosyltransferase involved in cell wall biosynthesis